MIRLAIRLTRRVLRPRRHYQPTARQQWYRGVYLQSPHWVAFRRQWWNEHPNARCHRCHRRQRPMDLHHLTYRRLGHERPTDVIPLHRSCHNATHRRTKGRR